MREPLLRGIVEAEFAAGEISELCLGAQVIAERDGIARDFELRAARQPDLTPVTPFSADPVICVGVTPR